MTQRLPPLVPRLADLEAPLPLQGGQMAPSLSPAPVLVLQPLWLEQLLWHLLAHNLRRCRYVYLQACLQSQGSLSACGAFYLACGTVPCFAAAPQQPTEEKLKAQPTVSQPSESPNNPLMASCICRERQRLALWRQQPLRTPRRMASMCAACWVCTHDLSTAQACCDNLTSRNSIVLSSPLCPNRVHPSLA